MCLGLFSTSRLPLQPVKGDSLFSECIDTADSIILGAKAYSFRAIFHDLSMMALETGAEGVSKQ